MHGITALVITDGRDYDPCAPDPGPALTPFRAVWIACLTTRRHSRARPGTDGARL